MSGQLKTGSASASAHSLGSPQFSTTDTKQISSMISLPDESVLQTQCMSRSHMPHLSACRAWKILLSFNSIVEPGSDSEKDVEKEVGRSTSSSRSDSFSNSPHSTQTKAGFPPPSSFSSFSLVLISFLSSSSSSAAGL